MLRIKGLATGDGKFRTLVSIGNFPELKPRLFQRRHLPLVLIFWLAAHAFCSPGDPTDPMTKPRANRCLDLHFLL